jgi:DNA-binding helix-turn-helix protein
MDSFSEILQEFLKINSLTQKNFAEAIEVKPSQVSEWLKGKVVPGYYSLKKIAVTFCISADYLLGLKEDYF